MFIVYGVLAAAWGWLCYQNSQQALIGHFCANYHVWGTDTLELVFLGIALILVPATVLKYVGVNKQRDALQREADEKGIKYTPDVLRRLGDRAPDFRYTL